MGDDNRILRSDATVLGIMTGLAGLLTGLILGPAIGPSSKDKAKIFLDENPRIIRTYENRRSDHIYVEHPNNSNEYITLDKYLELKNTKKEEQIKKTSDW